MLLSSWPCAVSSSSVPSLTAWMCQISFPSKSMGQTACPVTGLSVGPTLIWPTRELFSFWLTSTHLFDKISSFPPSHRRSESYCLFAPSFFLLPGHLNYLFFIALTFLVYSSLAYLLSCTSFFFAFFYKFYRHPCDCVIAFSPQWVLDCFYTC